MNATAPQQTYHVTFVDGKTEIVTCNRIDLHACGAVCFSNMGVVNGREVVDVLLIVSPENYKEVRKGQVVAAPASAA